MSLDEKTPVNEPVEAGSDTKPIAVSAEKQTPDSDSGVSTDDESAHLHAKTWLAVLAVGMIYFAQLVNLVGAGAVSNFLSTRAEK